MVDSVQQEVAAPDSATRLAVLERVLASTQLRRAARLRELLQYVGQRSLKDGHDQIREQVIGVEVFARPEGYDTSVDNIVRVNATELRKRIDTYFATEGAGEPVIMEIPRGSYVPVFRNRPPEPAIEAEVPAPAEAVEPEPLEEHPEELPARGLSGWAVAGLIAAGIVTIVLAAACLILWMQNRAMRARLYPWESKPAVASLWNDFLNANPNTDVVIGDAGFGMLQILSGQTISLQDYLSHNYVDQLPAAQSQSPEMRPVLSMIARWALVSRGGFTMAQHFSDLDPLNNKIRLYFSRNYMPSLVKRDNLILFGTRISNPWMEIFEDRLNFIEERRQGGLQPPGTPHSFVTNRSPAAGEQTTYIPTSTMGYCTVAYLPNPEHNGKVLLIQGTSSEAAQGCGDFLLSESAMANFQKTLRATKFPYFEVLLSTSQMLDIPLSTKIVAYRTYPNLR
ncbi:MAG: hypothetical protein KGL37_10010 [Acidobacteriota bacterium]|nr:hypothetical protein [Acidobacteriota bacterium]